jgi:cell wall-associated NlpC family hydrolase
MHTAHCFETVILNPRPIGVLVRGWQRCNKWLLLFSVGIVLAGCSAPKPRVGSSHVVVQKASGATIPASIEQKAAHLAEKYVGVPYRYGGSTPQGFDCSGLVYFVYHSLGVAVPRTALEQHEATRPVARHDLRPGDLVFFYTSVEHVGIYTGNNEFIHAPSTGKDVRKSSLDTPYFAQGFAGGGRLTEPSTH